MATLNPLFHADIIKKVEFLGGIGIINISICDKVEGSRLLGEIYCALRRAHSRKELRHEEAVKEAITTLKELGYQIDGKLLRKTFEIENILSDNIVELVLNILHQNGKNFINHLSDVRRIFQSHS